MNQFQLESNISKNAFFLAVVYNCQSYQFYVLRKYNSKNIIKTISNILLHFILVWSYSWKRNLPFTAWLLNCFTHVLQTEWTLLSTITVANNKVKESWGVDLQYGTKLCYYVQPVYWNNKGTTGRVNCIYNTVQQENSNNFLYYCVWTNSQPIIT